MAVNDIKILLIGGGGREHALAWKLSQSPRVAKIFVCPGNGGTSSLSKTTNIDLSSSPDFAPLVAFSIQNEINLVVPGPEQPLVDGVETAFRKVGIPVFGPSARAANMEGSKAFSKAFMTRHAIPTAKYRTFSASQFQDACDYVKTCGFDVVLKASGLAGGKGVLIPGSIDEAIASLREIMVLNMFGTAGNEVVVEERLTGPELSVLAFSDGYTILPLPAAQDHKRIGEGDTGPNTGGMGAYAPAPIASDQLMQRIMKETLLPTISGMRREGFPFVGLLFTGFMLTDSGPKVLEYNVRFGDPETEALVLLLSEDTDLGSIMLACVEHRLDSVTLNIRSGSAVSVVLASKGYPGSYSKGKFIEIGNTHSDVVVFHAGTTVNEGKLLTSGGRVLVVSSFAATLREAVDKVYAAINEIKFEGAVYRSDIAYRALLPRSLDPGKGLTYADADVSIDAGNSFVEAIKPLVKSTRRPGSDGSIGGFGGVFDLKAAGFADPVLVSGTDGVGTKLRVAMEVGKHDTVGIDLVAMSVNDLIVQGAEPLYFLDYYGCAKLTVETAVEVLKGITEGCRQANCALIGGETAEMPSMYQGDDYDLAGFAVGAVERSMILPSPDIAAGDILLGLPSSGVHSNGFSLIRKVVGLSGLTYSSKAPWDPSRTLGSLLLEPTRIYIRTLLPALKVSLLKGLSNITGGGFTENIPRVLPKGLGCWVDARAWNLPEVFKFLMKEGGIAPAEMARTFNNGVGMVLVVAPEKVEEVIRVLKEAGEEDVYRIGEVVEGSGCEMRNMEAWVN